MACPLGHIVTSITRVAPRLRSLWNTISVRPSLLDAPHEIVATADQIPGAKLSLISSKSRRGGRKPRVFNGAGDPFPVEDVDRPHVLSTSIDFCFDATHATRTFERSDCELWSVR
jgi:hypothetical protein